MTEQDVPIFPLRTILFPGSKLPLRIFEPRYLDMISRCMPTNQEFGIVLIGQKLKMLIIARQMLTLNGTMMELLMPQQIV